jgi:hypothetical protein
LNSEGFKELKYMWEAPSAVLKNPIPLVISSLEGMCPVVKRPARSKCIWIELQKSWPGAKSCQICPAKTFGTQKVSFSLTQAKNLEVKVVDAARHELYCFSVCSY